MYKTQRLNGLSLLLLERQIALHLSWCNMLVVMLRIKLGVKTRVNLEVKLGIELEVKLGAKSLYWPS